MSGPQTNKRYRSECRYEKEPRWAVILNRRHVRANIVNIRLTRKWGGDASRLEAHLAWNWQQYRETFHRECRDRKTVFGTYNSIIEPLQGAKR